jgi:hypothetical protein
MLRLENINQKRNTKVVRILSKGIGASPNRAEMLADKDR